jgi:hypothetical protein
MQSRIGACAAGLFLIGLFATGCAGPSHENTAEASTPTEPPVDAIDELTASLEEMGVRASPRTEFNPSFDLPTNVVVLGNPPTTPEGLSSDVHSEVALLREHIHQMERSLTFYMDTVVTDLREENAYLRDELARIYANIPLEDRMRPVVPRPGSSVLNEVQDHAADPNYSPRSSGTPVDPSGPLELNVVKEWGRTPDQAAEIGRGVHSLKGIIGSVAPGADDETLLQFGRELREQYDEYTNINIVIFDSELAANAYAERNAKSTTRHVITIARHGQTGLDEIYIHRNGLVVQTERF